MSDLIARRCPIHLGGLSDPFQPAERRFRTTLEALRVLRAHDYPVVISTKGYLLLDEPRYLQLIASHRRCAVQISFSTLDDDLAAKLEPGAPLPSERLTIIEALAKASVWVAVRLQPILFPFESANAYRMETLASAGAQHVIVEHLRLPTNFPRASLLRLGEILGGDILRTYERLGMHIHRVNRELVPEVKIHNVLRLRSEAHQAGLTFGIGDNTLHHLSDDDCCCGVKYLAGFENIYTGHFVSALKASSPTGIVNRQFIERAWHPSGSIREYINPDCRSTSARTMRDHLLEQWNDPRASNSPCTFYGVSNGEGRRAGTYEVDSTLLKYVRGERRSKHGNNSKTARAP